jgi:hypothetical protein
VEVVHLGVGIVELGILPVEGELAEGVAVSDEVPVV